MRYYSTRKSWNVLNRATPGSPGGNAIIYSQEMLQLIANSCQTRSEMATFYSSAYQAALKHKKLNKIFARHLNEGYKNKSFRITYEWCLKCASTCNTRKEFRQKFPSETTVAGANNWMEKIFRDHKNQGYQEGITHGYTYQEVFELASKCRDRQSFLKKFRGAHSKAVQKGWLDTLFKDHMNQGYRTAKGYLNLSKKECSFFASFCLTRQQLKTHYPPYYNKAFKSGWLDDIFQEHPNKGYQRMSRNWSLNDIQIAANKCRTRGEFKRRFSGAYRKIVGTSKIDKIFEHHDNRGYLHKTPTKSTKAGYWRNAAI